MLTFRSWLLVPLAGSLLLAHAAPPEPAKPLAFQVETDVPVKMRDGVVLRADVYRPVDGGPHAVLLVRTPYDKVTEGEACRRGAQRGFICVAQDVRGRFGSEGEWYPFRHETADGSDTVAWAAALPGADGRVGMFGASYVGATQWLASLARPPHLVALAPAFTASNYHEGWVYEGGALEQWFIQSWTSILAVDTLRRQAMEDGALKEWPQHLAPSAYPVLRPPVPSTLAPYYHDWLAHPRNDAYWKPWCIEDHTGELSVAAQHIGGWYDLFLGGTLRNYTAMKAHAATAWAREHQRLLIGPWVPDQDPTGKAGAVDYGPAAALDETGAMLDWYETLFKGTAAAPTRPVRIFVMGTNQWRDEDDWPLPRTRFTPYYLHGGGHANTAGGDGALDPRAPLQETPDTFTYDPADPVPTQGGQLCCRPELVPSGILDQRPIEARNDVLVYSTPPFDQAFEVTGPVVAELQVSSSAPDTDLTAKLVDVWPNGFVQNLTDSILRLRYRNSRETPEPLEPGRIYQVRLELGATSNVFLKGHRLRLELSSSNFPRFSRNLNTLAEPEQGTASVKARNTIHHDALHPSLILLPVIPVNPGS